MPENGRIDAVDHRVQPGEHRKLLIANLCRCMTGSLESLSCSVRKAEVALGGCGDPGVLQEAVEVLVEGGFGIVKGARHSVFTSDVAIKRLKQVRLSQVFLRRLRKSHFLQLLDDDNASKDAVARILENANPSLTEHTHLLLQDSGVPVSTESNLGLPHRAAQAFYVPHHASTKVGHE